MSKSSKKVLSKLGKRAIAQFQLVESWNCSNDISNSSLEVFATSLVKCASFISRLPMFFHFVTIISFFLFSRKSSCFFSQLSLACASRTFFFKRIRFSWIRFIEAKEIAKSQSRLDRTHFIHFLKLSPTQQVLLVEAWWGGIGFRDENSKEENSVTSLSKLY